MTLIEDKPEVLCLSHKNCFDGLGAAWAVRQRFPEAEVKFVNYDEPAPNVLGKVVYITDFCYPIEELMTMLGVVEELHIFDHHKGMAEVITQFNEAVAALGLDKTRFRGVFDNTQSGALLTWNELFPDHQLRTPRILLHISDRDLFEFKLDNTKAVMAGLALYDMDLETWDRIFHYTPDYDPLDTKDPHNLSVDDFEDEGRVVLKYQKQAIERVIKNHLSEITIAGHTVPCVNVPKDLVSETLAILAKGKPFAVGYFDSHGKREYSLRSDSNGMDVSEICKRFGGGGHQRAAGFIVRKSLAEI